MKNLFSVFIAFGCSIFISQSLFAGPDSLELSAVPMVRVELEKSKMINVIDTIELQNGIGKTKFRWVENGYLMLQVVVPSEKVKDLKVEALVEGAFDQRSLDQCLSAKVTEILKRDFGKNVVGRYLVEYDLNLDDGDNYCGVKIKNGETEKVILFGFTVND